MVGILINSVIKNLGQYDECSASAGSVSSGSHPFCITAIQSTVCKHKFALMAQDSEASVGDDAVYSFVIVGPSDDNESSTIYTTLWYVSFN